ncbi:OmpA family protein [Amphritea japonica]|uniref:OmpA-OmpF porin, OOP family n=1 Tax=Amphritea japonica ATCC BAA-1530 TaxID=1278309 RepID=A0A7R6SRN2_9GAMM|nr:OmpA family protein [Amphritea japonica]BBB25366.1 OmpA-OmpF porin, OOP family [Amphritea japonica ATCC BAA-1530]
MKKLVLTTALALTMGISAAAQAHPDHAGYATSSNDTVWKTSNGECWQHSYWETDDKTVECGAEAAAPAPAPAPAPKMTMKMVDAEENHIVYFDFNSSNVTDVSAIVNYVGSLAKLNTIELKGYTDSIGSNAYNDALSQRRVEAVDAALAAAGIDTGKVVSHAYGEANPVKDCTDAGASRKSCLADNRRVEVSINGQKQIKVQQ